MHESYTKYRYAERTPTNPLIDETPIVFAGRTLYELLITAGAFMVPALMFESLVGGLILGSLCAWLLPAYRTKLPRGWLIHKSWSLGLHSRKKINGSHKVFSLRSKHIVRGP